MAVAVGEVGLIEPQVLVRPFLFLFTLYFFILFALFLRRGVERERKSGGAAADRRWARRRSPTACSKPRKKRTDAPGLVRGAEVGVRVRHEPVPKNTPHLESYEVANVSCANPSDVALLALPSWFEVYPESTSQYVRKPLGTVRRICSVDLCLFPLRKGKDKCQVEKEKACAASDGTCKFEGVACLTHEDVKGIFVCNTEGTFGHQIVGCLSE